MTAFIAILHKDLRLELRGGECTIALVALSLLILVVLVFALNPAGGVRDARLPPVRSGSRSSSPGCSVRRARS